MNKFLIVATLCSFLLLAIVLSIGFSSFDNMTNGKTLQNPSIIVSYARKAMSTAMGVAAPVLNKLGVNVGGQYSAETDEITRHLENASATINEATKKFTQ